MRRRSSLSRVLSLVAAFAVLAAGCGDDGEAADPPADSTTTTTSITTSTSEPSTTTTEEPGPTIGDAIPTPNPEVSLPPEVGSPFYQGVGFDLGLIGYEQHEYFISGTARSFAASEELTPDGHWATEVGPDEADYTSRIVVVRPSDPADFGGTVVMEWFNVSGGIDAAANLTMSHVQQFREGAAFVGVSAQFRGIEAAPGTIDIGFPIFLKGASPDRYGSLSHPGDTFSYDIFNQAAQAVRSPEGIDPLDGLGVETMIATGDSQSAFRLTTYVNAVDPLVQLFDGFLIHSRGGGSASLSQEPQEPVPTPGQVLIREDVRVPVLTFQTETDLGGLAWVPDRQPDSDNIVLWEVAGTAHGDVYSVALDVGPQDLGDDPDIAAVVERASPIPGILECGEPINSGPQHYVMNAAIHALFRWAAGGDPPPSAPRTEVDASNDAVRDEHGNILGGVRTAWVDVPIATLTGNPPAGGGFCRLFGTTSLFDDAKLVELYGDNETYVELAATSLAQSVADGFLMQADADLILEYVQGNPIIG